MSLPPTIQQLAQRTTCEPSLQKGLGLLRPREMGAAGDIGRSVASLGWSLLREDLSLPAAVLRWDRVLHNLQWMRRFVEAYGVKLAPHGKTTMAPKLFAAQMAHGAWGITVATAHQAAIAYTHGVRRVLMANQLVGRANMGIISELVRDPGLEFVCLVDSVEVVGQMGAFFRGRGQTVHVLLELGVAGGRTGVRDSEGVEAVLRALSAWENTLSLRGVEVYEGVLQEEGAIRQFLRWAVEVTRKIAETREGRSEKPLILSGAGSAWYDVVAEEFAPAARELGVEVVLRPGCYVTSDAGIYREAQERIRAENPVASRMPETPEPALQVWAYVQSIPESGRAILTLGKRDAAFDAGLPTPVLHFRPGWGAPRPMPGGSALERLMDQHAYLAFRAGEDLRVGDMIGCEISHPCLTFDRWRYLPVVDADYEVIDLLETFF